MHIHSLHLIQPSFKNKPSLALGPTSQGTAAAQNLACAGAAVGPVPTQQEQSTSYKENWGPTYFVSAPLCVWGKVLWSLHRDCPNQSQLKLKGKTVP